MPASQHLHADPAAKALGGKAQDITLPILTPAGSGSIAIIGKRNGTTHFLRLLM